MGNYWILKDLRPKRVGVLRAAQWYLDQSCVVEKTVLNHSTVLTEFVQENPEVIAGRRFFYATSLINRNGIAGRMLTPTLGEAKNLHYRTVMAARYKESQQKHYRIAAFIAISLTLLVLAITYG